MAILTLFVKNRSRISAMELDVAITEDHQLTAQISRSEVEQGGDITDNVVLDPRRITIEGVVSKTPIGNAALAASLVTAAAGQVGQGPGLGNTAAFVGAASIGGLVAAGLNSVDGPKTREPKDVFTYLEFLYENRVPFEVQTGLRLYESMVFSSLRVPRNSKTTNLLQFTATLEQVRLISSREGSVTLPAASVVDGATKSADIGKQAATGATQKVSDNSTLAFKAFKSFGGAQ